MIDQDHKEFDFDELRKHIEVGRHLIDSISFEWQKEKMTNTMGWYPDLVEKMEISYRAYLSAVYAIRKVDSEFSLVPNRLIDEFWHMHILDTEKYFIDCKAIFGDYMHHYPYFGIQGEGDAATWKIQSARSDDIWMRLFGAHLHTPILDGEETDAYGLDKHLYAEMSKHFLEDGGISTMGTRCRTCRAAKCP